MIETYKVTIFNFQVSDTFGFKKESSEWVFSRAPSCLMTTVISKNRGNYTEKFTTAAFQLFSQSNAILYKFLLWYHFLPFCVSFWDFIKLWIFSKSYAQIIEHHLIKNSLPQKALISLICSVIRSKAIFKVTNSTIHSIDSKKLCLTSPFRKHGAYISAYKLTILFNFGIQKNTEVI